MICDVSRKGTKVVSFRESICVEFQQIYDRLDVTLTEKGESFYQKGMEVMVKELEDQKIVFTTLVSVRADWIQLVEDETAPGRKIAWSSAKEKTHLPLILVKSDGGFTYDTSDLACIRYRACEEKAEWIVYVVDKGQDQHFINIFSLAKDLGWTTNARSCITHDYCVTCYRVDHVGFGVVLGEDHKKFKTRSGDTVLLKNLLDEGITRAREALRDRQGKPDVS